MSRLPICLILAIFSMACAKKEHSGAPVHATCAALDKRGVTDRMDNLTSSNPEDFRLDGHCLEALFSQPSGNVWAAQFAPKSVGDGPPFHIQMYFSPPQKDIVMEVYRPDDLVKAKCQDVPDEMVCAHIDDNTDDPGVDDVDLRVLTGTLDMHIDDVSEETTTYTGDMIWTVWGVDTAPEPDEPTEPSILVKGTLHLTVTN